MENAVEILKKYGVKNFRVKENEIWVLDEEIPKDLQQYFDIETGCISACGFGGYIEKGNKLIIDSCYCHPDAYFFVLKKKEVRK